MSDVHVIVQCLKAGQERQELVGEALAAFQRLAPADHAHFLAMIAPMISPLSLLAMEPAPPAPVLTSSPPLELAAPTNLADATKTHIERVVADSDGNISEAARKLGIFRSSLQRKLRRTRVANEGNEVPDTDADDAKPATEPALEPPAQPIPADIPPADIPPPNARGRRPRDWLRASVLAVLADGELKTLTRVCVELEPRLAPVVADKSSVFCQLARLIEDGLVISEGARRHRGYALRSAGTAAKAPPASAADPEPERAPAPPIRIAPVAPIAPIRAVSPPRPQAVKPVAPARRPEYSRIRDKDVPPVDIHAIYSREIKRVKLLTREDEIQLANDLANLEVALWELLWEIHRDEAIARLNELAIYGTKGARRKISNGAQARKLDLDRIVATEIVNRWELRLQANKTALQDLPLESDERRRALAELQRAQEQLRRARSLERQADQVRNAFASANLRLVLAFIKRKGYDRGTGLDLADLVQEGNLGLMHAIPRFNPSSGNKFNTYAGWWIRHHLVRARQNMGGDVRQPVHVQELTTRVVRMRNRIEAKLGRHATDIEIATQIVTETLTNRLGRAPTADEIDAEAAPLLRRMASIDRHAFALRHRESMPIADSVGGEDTDDAVSTFASETPTPSELLWMKVDREALDAALELLPDLLADVIRRRYGLGDEEPMKLREVGDLYGVSRERIRQLEANGLAALRHALRRHKRAA